jgi:hypothetical protein
MSAHADGLEEFSLRADFLYRRATLIANPDVVVGIDCHAVGLVLVADHVIADSANLFVILVEFKELRFSGGIALQDPKLSFRSDANSRGAASTYG